MGGQKGIGGGVEVGVYVWSHHAVLLLDWMLMAKAGEKKCGCWP